MNILGKTWRCYDMNKTTAKHLKKFLLKFEIKFDITELETSTQVDIFADPIQELMVNSFIAGFDSAENEYCALPF